MTGRIRFGLLTLMTALVTLPVQAQTPQGNGVQPAGFHHFQENAGQYNAYPGYYQRCPAPQVQGAAPPTTYRELPDDLGFADDDTLLGKMLIETFRHSWFRTEYLLWNISGPGDVLLSEQLANSIVSDTSTTGTTPNVGISSGLTFTRTVVDTTGNNISGSTQAPSLDDFAISNVSGFRGTYGLPLPIGTIELSGFVLGASTSQLDADINTPGSLIQPQIIANPAATVGGTVGSDGNPATNGQTATFVSQAILIDGQRANGTTSSGNFLDYDQSYHAKLTTSVWGTEGNWVGETQDPNGIFQLVPTVGFRYLNFQDKLLQNGQYSDSTTSTIVNRQINSNAHNNVLGPQIGLRAELRNQWFLIGFEPKVMAGINQWQSALDTANVVSASDPGQSLIQRGTTFSPLVDLKGYTNVSISKNLSAYVSYNFIWTGSLNRSYDDIVYNKSSVTNRSDFSLQKVYSSATIQGMSFGFEYRY